MTYRVVENMGMARFGKFMALLDTHFTRLVVVVVAVIEQIVVDKKILRREVSPGQARLIKLGICRLVVA